MNRILCVGLGNPGENYTSTRHNAGWLLLDSLIDSWSDPSIPPRWKKEKNVHGEVLRLNRNQHEWIFLKPSTFMNESGKSVASACKWFLDIDPAEANPQTAYKNVVVVHDDLDLETGRHKLQYASGPKVHNGVNSIRDALKNNNFWTARIGVDSRGGDRSIPGKAYVLQNIPPEEQRAIAALAPVLSEEFLYTVLQ